MDGTIETEIRVREGPPGACGPPRAGDVARVEMKRFHIPKSHVVYAGYAGYRTVSCAARALWLCLSLLHVLVLLLLRATCARSEKNTKTQKQKEGIVERKLE